MKHWCLGLSLFLPSSNPGTQVCTHGAIGLLDWSAHTTWPLSLLSSVPCAFQLWNCHCRKIPGAPRVGG